MRGGVYYTPRFVVDTIIRRVIGPQIEGKTPSQLLDVRILDPACGSGSFLVAAFQYLIDHCLAAIAADPALAKVPATPKARKKRKEIAFKDDEGVWHLAPDFKAALLTSCIHGVDIDHQAVEVTVMSLYIKMVEGKLPPQWQKNWLENELLPPLDGNILCGNSLIDSTNFDRYCEKAFGNLFTDDNDIRFRMNRFDWESRTRGFGRYFDDEKPKLRRGFDCIIGNPPYIRVQELNQWAPEECEFYKWRYQSAKKGNYDIYVVFVERCLELLAANGLLGFIMPHKFWQAKYGEGLRKLIADGGHLRSVVDFGDQQVFSGATTYTAIHVLSKESTANNLDFARIRELHDGKAQCEALDRRRVAPSGGERFRAPLPQGDNPWVFSDTRRARWLETVRGSHAKLGTITYKIAQGLVSGCDRVFYVSRRDRSVYSEQTGKTYRLESSLLHPLLKGSVHIRRWVPDISELVVVFPYRLVKGEWRLIEPKEMRADFPQTYEYFSECREVLERRESGRFKGAEYYQFSRPQNFEVMRRPKVLVPAIAQRGEYAADLRGEYYFVGSGGGGGGAHAVLPSDNNLDLRYLCGLLNSRCLDTFLQSVTTPFHSGWFAYSKAYIAQIPIKLPETAAETKLAGRIIEYVQAIMEDKTRLRDGKLSEREVRTIENDAELHERRIDEAVFRLYGVEGLPE